VSSRGKPGETASTIVNGVNDKPSKHSSRIAGSSFTMSNNAFYGKTSTPLAKGLAA